MGADAIGFSGAITPATTLVCIYCEKPVGDCACACILCGRDRRACACTGRDYAAAVRGITCVCRKCRISAVADTLEKYARVFIGPTGRPILEQLGRGVHPGKQLYGYKWCTVCNQPMAHCRRIAGMFPQ